MRTRMTLKELSLKEIREELAHRRDISKGTKLNSWEDLNAINESLISQGKPPLARIALIPYDPCGETKTFHYLNVNPKGRKTGDCTIRAIANALDISWEQVLKELTELSLETGYMLDCKEGYDLYLKRKGWVKNKQPKKAGGKKYSGAEFCEQLAKKKQRYILKIGSHHLTSVADKKVNDIWNCTEYCVGNYWTKATS